ncbi:SRPBCC domain-containing protein [Nocardia arthritidis]|uniref:SRPBCC domain-containing protein n=1 Tax=Nocardia arthritidis TaxID=228602 RepID=A0A6G9YNI5_9NOCA|nr:SRPBCC domain-containing protein [Nocardia arthritidis]QIS14762.1 SRPBCC domain-containing protein [Nocardia arthritidis]
MAFVIDSGFETDVPAAVVWQVITDFPRYGEWNTFCIECRSTLVPGDPIDMLVHLGPRTRRQREWVRTHTPGAEFSYSMKPVPFGALHSVRRHRVTALGPDRTRYESHFELAGWLRPAVTALLGDALRTGFAAMTEGIEREARRIHAA